MKWVVCIFSRFLGAPGQSHWGPWDCLCVLRNLLGYSLLYCGELKWAHQYNGTIKQSGVKYCMLYCCNRFVRVPRLPHPPGQVLGTPRSATLSGVRCGWVTPMVPPISIILSNDSPLINYYSHISIVPAINCPRQGPAPQHVKMKSRHDADAPMTPNRSSLLISLSNICTKSH